MKNISLKQLKSRLSPIYNKIKSAYEEEEYLSETIYHKYRSAITKFRISAHCFPIEYGRWIKIEHDNRYVLWVG